MPCVLQLLGHRCPDPPEPHDLPKEVRGSGPARPTTYSPPSRNKHHVVTPYRMCSLQNVQGSIEDLSFCTARLSRSAPLSKYQKPKNETFQAPSLSRPLSLSRFPHVNILRLHKEDFFSHAVSPVLHMSTAFCKTYLPLFAKNSSLLSNDSYNIMLLLF